MQLTVPFSPALAIELAEREAALASTSDERVAAAQSLIKQCYPLTVEREVTVLEPYTTFEGAIEYRKVLRTRTYLIR